MDIPETIYEAPENVEDLTLYDTYEDAIAGGIAEAAELGA